MNNRLVLYFEDLNWFADERNGFRKNRSCQDHAYILNSIVKNRQSENLHTYVAFVDIQKAFDWLDRDLLMLKLFMNNINGKYTGLLKACTPVLSHLPFRANIWQTHSLVTPG